MPRVERQTIVEKAIEVSKAADLVGIVTGLIIAGATGAAIALTSGLSLVFTDRIQNRSKK